MKKILLFISMVIFLIFNYNYTFAQEPTTIEITVTEKVPWANCTQTEEQKKDWKWTCWVKPWIASIQWMMWNFIKIFTAIWALAWVLFIVINWIMLSMWWMDSSIKDKAKKNITWAIIWLILLLLSWVILKMIAPWVYY